MGPLYPRMLSERFGMASAVSEIVEAAHRDHGEELPPAAEELADEVTLMGTYERAGELIQSWFAAGADTLALVLPPGRPERELGEIIEAVAAVDAHSTPPRASDR
jgi:alkanesulfonate monooxygenase SsuD/methylene tetrahydromethanopterin reductase-like flavin-dependent oxidoreductase (luciferase family)